MTGSRRMRQQTDPRRRHTSRSAGSAPAHMEVLLMAPTGRSLIRVIPLLMLVAGIPAPVSAQIPSIEPALTPLWESDRPADNLAIDPSGRLWASTPGSAFDIYDRDGDLLETWGTFGRDDGQLDLSTPAGPRGGVAFRPDGGFYVADSDNARIQEFDADRAFVRSWGSFGTGDDQFIGPDSIALDAAGDIYVNETVGERSWIHVFDEAGNQVRLIRENAQGPFFAGTQDGTVYVIDEAGQDVVAVRPDGTTEDVGDLSGLMSFGTGILHLPDGGTLVASEWDGATGATTGPENLVRVGVDGQILGVWPNGGWYMALDPAGDRFYISSDKLRAYALPSTVE